VVCYGLSPATVGSPNHIDKYSVSPFRSNNSSLDCEITTHISVFWLVQTVLCPPKFIRRFENSPPLSSGVDDDDDDGDDGDEDRDNNNHNTNDNGNNTHLGEGINVALD
jgi:hypothetical protein